MHAAESNDPNNVLVSYGYGSNVPSTAKRRLKHGILLARRLLSSQKDVHGLNRKLEAAALKETQLSEELDQANAMLDTTSQPYHYMVEGMRSRDGLVKDLHAELDSMKATIDHLQKEKQEFLKVKNAMSADLEHLLSNRQELDEVRQQISSLEGLEGQGRASVQIDPHAGNKAPAPAPSANTHTAPATDGARFVRQPSIHIEGVGMPQPWWYNRLVIGGAVGSE